jgi:threonine dehydrogenase-like Zn-dependent dehydrogenase
MATRPGELGMGELNVPEPDEYEALVRMDACAICNSTDHKLMLNEFCPGTFPVVLGHEVVGTVTAVGPKVVNFEPGDRVFRQCLYDSHVPGEGRSCWGGFAEFGVVTDEWARQGVPYGPDPLPHAQQKLMLDVEPALATGMVTLMETLDCITTCGARPGVSVAVVGSGPVGQALAMFAGLLGASPVYAFGRDPAHARRFVDVCGTDGYAAGTDLPADVRKIADGGGFDVVVEAVGSADALATCVRLAGSKGRVCVYGIAPKSAPHASEDRGRANVTAVGAKEGRVQARLASFVEAGKVRLEDWVSHRLPLNDFQRAFDLVERKQAMKAVLLP